MEKKIVGDVGGGEVVVALEALEAPQHLAEASLEERRSVLWVKKQISKAFAFNSRGGQFRKGRDLVVGKVILTELDLECIWGSCRDCESDVASYLCNADLKSVRPEGDEWDWWMSCTNPDCKHHYGEGYFQDEPSWVLRKRIT